MGRVGISGEDNLGEDMKQFWWLQGSRNSVEDTVRSWETG